MDLSINKIIKYKEFFIGAIINLKLKLKV